MGLMAPGLGNIGKTAVGKSTPRTVNGNGAAGVVGTLDLPESGVWVVIASGWNPKVGTECMMGMNISGGANLPATDCLSRHFSLSGIVQVEKPSTVNLTYTNYGTSQVVNATVTSLKFMAVKVGEV